MRVKLAENYGFCFGVKRAIKIAEETKKSYTIGPLIHNPKEINRLEKNFNVKVADKNTFFSEGEKVIIRTHGIPKEDLKELQEKKLEIIDATCPFVSKPQQICEQMSREGYDIVIFGDKDHPEVKGVKSYAIKEPLVVLDVKELENSSHRLKERIAVVSQTTKKVEDFMKVVNHLINHYKEVRVFNTICNATLDNQKSADKLSKEVDIVIVIGGKNSSNTKQLFNICVANCKDSYLIESETDLEESWFKDKESCGVTAGASTPSWIIERVVDKIGKF